VNLEFHFKIDATTFRQIGPPKAFDKGLKDGTYRFCYSTIDPMDIGTQKSGNLNNAIRWYHWLGKPHLYGMFKGSNCFGR